MATYTLISSNVLSSSVASVTFSSIPATYTDLVLRYSARSDGNPGKITVAFNGTSSGFSDLYLQGAGTGGTASASETALAAFNFYSGIVRSTYTANTFSSAELYIPNYTVAQNKPTSSFAVTENNSASAAVIQATAGLWSNTAAITSIEIAVPSNNMVSGSSFYLYGISNA